MNKKHLTIFFILIGIFFAFKTNAQLASTDIILGTNPEYPRANTDVTASVSTYTIDLNNTKISWTLNGSLALEGIGKKSFSFKTGSSGTQTSLSVKIVTANGTTVNKQIIISPSDIDILWEAYNTYTPPFYKGKKLLSMEGSAKVVAMPSTQNLTGLSYNWIKDNKNDADSSGYEQNYFIYQNSYLDDGNTIGVSASDIFGNNVGTNEITINPSNPKIILYKKDPILGTNWDNALSDNFSIDKDGEMIVAEPYFFSNDDLSSGDLTFTWSLNGQDTMIPNQKNILAIKPEAGKSGTTEIQVIISNTKTLFQSITKTVNVNF